MNEIVKLIAMLNHSPKYSWNASNHLGRVQLASAIDIISAETENLWGIRDFKVEYEEVLDNLNNRSEDTYKRRLKTTIKNKLTTLIRCAYLQFLITVKNIFSYLLYFDCLVILNIINALL